MKNMLYFTSSQTVNDLMNAPVSTLLKIILLLFSSQKTIIWSKLIKSIRNYGFYYHETKRDSKHSNSYILFYLIH
jgi:hypothetical protein